MARLYANENFPLPVVVSLRQLGHDVVSTQETGKGGQRIPDDEVLAFATSQQRTVLTHNRRDFIKLHAASSAHSGIIVCTTDLDFSGLAQRIHDVISGRTVLSGLLLRVQRTSQ